MHFCFTGSLVMIKHANMFPQCYTSRAAVGLGILLDIVDTGKVILVQVEVKSTWVVAKGAVNQLCSNVWYCIFFFSIVFISLFSIRLGGFKGIDRNVCSRSVSSFSFTPKNLFFSGENSLYHS